MKESSQAVLPIFEALHPKSQFKERCALCAYRATVFTTIGSHNTCHIDNLKQFEIALTGLSKAAFFFELRLCAGYARRN